MMSRQRGTKQAVRCAAADILDGHLCFVVSDLPGTYGELVIIVEDLANRVIIAEYLPRHVPAGVKLSTYTARGIVADLYSTRRRVLRLGQELTRTRRYLAMSLAGFVLVIVVMAAMVLL